MLGMWCDLWNIVFEFMFSDRHNSFQIKQTQMRHLRKCKKWDWNLLYLSIRLLQLLFSVYRFYNGIFFMKFHYQNDNNLRDWRANSVVGILLIKKTVSKIHKTINNWLKAVDILGFCNNKIAVKFPMQPKTMTIAETTPVIQYFHRNRCCKIYSDTERKLYIKTYK